MKQMFEQMILSTRLDIKMRISSQGVKDILAGC